MFMPWTGFEHAVLGIMGFKTAWQLWYVSLFFTFPIFCE